MRQYRLFVLILLVYWATRLPGLDALPLHNDEGLHLTRAVEVWNLHPFWEIRDGKIINHWLIAAFYPQNAPVFVGRFATILVGAMGLAAAYTLALRHFGKLAALLAATAWITSPYLFLYERLAFSDAEAGALTVLAILSALRLTRTDHPRDAVITGLAFASALLMKFTAAPFGVSLVLILLALSQTSLRRKIAHLAMIGAVICASFAVPLGYLMLRGRDFFSIAMGWISTSGNSSETSGPAANLARLYEQLTGFGPPLWAILMIAGLYILLLNSKRGAVLVVGLLLPLTAMIVLGTEVLSRHYVVLLPLALALGGIGIGTLLMKLYSTGKPIATAGSIAALAFLFTPFALQAYSDPSQLPLPPGDRSQLITDHSGGYGLREAVRDFPATITQPEIPVVASMFPDSCHRANFYAETITMICAGTPAESTIEALLEATGAVYVLVDSAGLIGLDVTRLDANIQQIARYARPNDPPEQPSIVLWRLETTETP